MLRPPLPLALTRSQVGTGSNSRVVNTPDQYLEGRSSYPGVQTNRQMTRQLFKLSHGRFLPLPLQLIIITIRHYTD
jgi:hypothetical protein